MRFDGTVDINASPETVWNFLTDPDSVSQCAPGLKSLKVLEPDQKFQVVVSVGFGAVKTTFTVDVEWVDMVPLEKAKMKARGKAPGSAVEATSEMNLSPSESNGTTLDWSADVVVLGSIASLASRLMGSVTKKLTGDFFTCLKEAIET